MKKIFLLIAISLVSMKAHSVLVTPGDVLEIRFTMTSPATPATDIAEFFLFRTIFQEGRMTGELYDGEEYLGSYTNPIFSSGSNQVFSFISNDSLSSFLNPSIIDFSSIHDGTVDGRLRVSLENGFREIDPFDSGFYYGESVNGSGSHYNLGGRFEITGYSLSAVPIPGAALLFLSALSFLIGPRLIQRKILTSACSWITKWLRLLLTADARLHGLPLLSSKDAVDFRH